MSSNAVAHFEKRAGHFFKFAVAGDMEIKSVCNPNNDVEEDTDFDGVIDVFVG